jgi:AcrR family transcriptional regulator
MAAGTQPTTRARGRGRPPRLSRERILESALELVKRDGLGALSMRRLAEELDAGTMTLYGYFRGKDELLDALVDVSSARSKRLRELGDGPWRQQLRELILAVREVLAEHPWEVELRMRRPLVSPGAMRVPEAGLQILQAAGLAPAEAARAFRTLFLYTFGFSGFGDPDDPERVRRETMAQVAPLPADEYPAVSAAINELAATMAGEEQFEFGLDLLLDGIEARLGR